jgi:ATP-dependent helicase HrpB
LERESVVREAPLFVAAEVNEIEGRARDLTVRLSLATAVEMEWLKELFPGDFVEREQTVFDPAQRRVVVERQRVFRDLVLESRRSDSGPTEAAAAALAEEVLAGRCPLKEWGEEVEQWILRVNRLAEWWPELGLPAIGADDRRFMIAQICHGATSYKEIKEKPVWPVVKSWLSKSQQDLVEKYAPERLELPGGRKAKIAYSEKGPPTVAVRIQDLYGVEEGLWIADRRTPLVIQVLAPNFRPIQVTQNLGVFWRETYPKVKQELQRKYPKHRWR